MATLHVRGSSRGEVVMAATTAGQPLTNQTGRLSEGPAMLSQGPLFSHGMATLTQTPSDAHVNT